MKSRILCLLFPHWTIQRMWVACPELRWGELVIQRRDPRRGEVVVDCCPAGSQAGIRPGMPVAEAHAAVGPPVGKPRFPQTLEQKDISGKYSRKNSQGSPQGPCLARGKRIERHFVPYDPPADWVGLQRLAEKCQQFTPTVGLDDQFPPTALFLDITRTAPRFGGEQALGNELLAQFRQEGWVIQGGLAHTLGGAWAAAQHAQFQSIFSPLGTAWERFLVGIPTSHLRLDALTQERLIQLGIETLGPLLLLPRDGLHLRLGPLLLKRLDQLCGKRLEPIQAFRPQQPLEVQQLLEYPTDRWEVVEQVLERLVFELSQRLQTQGKGALQLEWDFLLPQGDVQRVEIGLFRPMAHSEYLRRLIWTRLQCHKNGILREIQGFGLRATRSVSLAKYRRQKLFTKEDQRSGSIKNLQDLQLTREDMDHEEEVGLEKFGELVEQLSCRLGREAVCGVRLAADPDPEHGYRYHELTGSQLEVPQSRKRTEERKRAEQFPLRLLPRPVPIKVQRNLRLGQLLTIESAGYLPGGSRIHLTEGPRRIQGGWWRGHRIARDYYRVQDHQGGCWWIFRDLTGGGWFLHGVYM